MPFGGTTYDPEQDKARLTQQLQQVKVLMQDGVWRTLAAIAQAVQSPEASVSARLRDLRKEKFGGYVVERRRVKGPGGLHEYRLLPPSGPLFRQRPRPV